MDLAHKKTTAQEQDEHKAETSTPEQPDPTKQKAVSLLTGGDISIRAGTASTTISSVYVGVGPLLVPCTNGEQKAESGDVTVQILVDNPDPELDQECLIVLPEAVAEALFGVPPAPLTVADWDKFQKDRSKRLQEKQKKSPASSTTTSSNTPTSSTASSSAQSTPQTAKR